MPWKVWLVVAVTCLVIGAHIAITSLVAAPCYATMLLSVGLILGCIIGILSHHRYWIEGEDYYDPGYAESGGLRGSSIVVGLLVMLFCLLSRLIFGPHDWTEPKHMMLGGFGYFCASILISQINPPTENSQWLITRQQAIANLRNAFLAFVLTAAVVTISIEVFGKVTHGTILALVQIFPLALIQAVLECIGWDEKTMKHRRSLGKSTFWLPLLLSLLALGVLYIFKVTEGEFLLMNKGMLAGTLCSIPLFWRHKGHNDWEYTAMGLVVFFAIMAYLRWMNLVMPVGAYAFFITLPLPTLLQTLIWPMRSGRPRERDLAEVL